MAYFPFANWGLGSEQLEDFKEFHMVHFLGNYHKEQRHLRSSHNKSTKDAEFQKQRFAAH